MGRQANKLKVEECHEIILKEFSKFREKKTNFEIPLNNFLMSSFAVFALKSPSLLQFEQHFTEEKQEDIISTHFLKLIEFHRTHIYEMF
ncbi:MAG: hypothetical protein HOP07_15075 [Bacteriovoracaceae bacterium]|nr:hypothetical protein [Bacteriovoracaceae bacterium]